MSRFDDYIARAAELRQRREPFVTATVVRVERPTSGRPGDRAIVTTDGRVLGWVGGSCAEPTVVAEARSALANGQSRLLRLSQESELEARREGMTDRAMTCFSGGTMEIFLEPHQAQPRLFVYGASPVGRALVALAQVAGYHTTLVELGGRDVSGSGADRIVDAEADLEAPELSGGGGSAVAAVVATHGTFDEVALRHADQLGAGYVGVVTSQRRFEAIAAELRQGGMSDEMLARVEGPAGLDIGAVTPEEIAVSILAQIITSRRRAALPETATRDVEIGEAAIDPICGMSVNPQGSRHSFEFDGVKYHFCCGGCRSKFIAAPAAFVSC